MKHKTSTRLLNKEADKFDALSMDDKYQLEQEDEIRLTEHEMRVHDQRLDKAERVSGIKYQDSEFLCEREFCDHVEAKVQV